MTHPETNPRSGQDLTHAHSHITRAVAATFSSPEPRSFWPAAGIESSGRTRFSEHVQSNRFIFSANQICQIWREVRESRTSGVGQSQSSQSLPQVRRIVALGTRMWQPWTAFTAFKAILARRIVYKNTFARMESDLFITGMITDRIGRHEILLPII